jgi:hypothetical protein
LCDNLEVPVPKSGLARTVVAAAVADERKLRRFMIEVPPNGWMK